MNPIKTQTPHDVISSSEREFGNIFKIFPNIESLIDLLVNKEPLQIAILLKSCDAPTKINFKKLTHTIASLVNNYTTFRVQFDTLKELIKLHFPNEDLTFVDMSFNKITDPFGPIFQKHLANVPPLSHDNFLLACFHSFDKLINFLTVKDISSIQKIFKSDGKIENFLNSIEKLIIEYEGNETLTINQWNCCYELIKVIFSNKDIDKLEIFNKKIENRLYSGILSRYSSPKSTEGLKIATLESIKILFDKLVKENTELKNSQTKIEFLKQIVKLNEQENQFSKFLKAYCTFLSTKRKYIPRAKCEAEIIEGKWSYPISNKLIKKFKSNSYFAFFNKNQTSYITLKTESPRIIPELKLIYKKHPETKEITKRFIAYLKRNFSNLNKSSFFYEKYKYQKNDFHKNYFPMLYNNHDKLKNSILRLEKNFRTLNGVEDELKFSDSFKEDLDLHSYFKNIQTLFSDLAKIELEILKKSPVKDKNLIKEQMNLRQQFYRKFPPSFYKNLPKYSDFINQSPEARYRLLNHQMKQPDGNPALSSAIVLECNLMEGIRQLVNYCSENEKKYEEMNDREISNLTKKITPLFTLNNNFMKLTEKFKDNHDFISSFLPVYLSNCNIDRFAKFGRLSGFTLSRVIDRFREIDFLYQQNCHSQRQLFFKASNTEHLSNTSFAPEKSESLNVVKMLPVEEILTAHIQEKEHLKNFLESNTENLESLPKSSKKPKIKILQKPQKFLDKQKKEQLKSIGTSAKKKSTSQYFNTISQAVKVTPFGKTELVPQSSISLLYPQKKQLDYLSSEFHQSSPLPGISPSWESTDPRVARWKPIPKLPLCPETFPEYPDRGDNQAVQRFYHTIPQIAHRFIETLGAKQKITQILASEQTPKKKKTTYTAIAKLSAIQQNADDSYSVIGEPIDGFYGIGISKEGVLFHDAFSTQAPSERLAKSNRTLAPTRFENKNFCVDIYEKGEKVYKVSIDDKILMKRLEIFRTKHVHNMK